MTVLVDTGVLYADHDTDASRHEDASDALETVYDGEFGAAYVTDYVYDETVTLTRKRTGSFSAAKRVGRRLRGADPYPSVYELLRVSNTGFADSVDIFERYDDQELSFTDATTVALCDRYDIESVLSFDDDFDGLVDRIDPSTV
jgi:predicted nucleic acid-binding protein